MVKMVVLMLTESLTLLKGNDEMAQICSKSNIISNWGLETRDVEAEADPEAPFIAYD